MYELRSPRRVAIYNYPCRSQRIKESALISSPATHPSWICFFFICIFIFTTDPYNFTVGSFVGYANLRTSFSFHFSCLSDQFWRSFIACACDLPVVDRARNEVPECFPIFSIVCASTGSRGELYETILLAKNLYTQLCLRSENDVFKVESSNLNKMVGGQDF